MPRNRTPRGKKCVSGAHRPRSLSWRHTAAYSPSSAPPSTDTQKGTRHVLQRFSYVRDDPHLLPRPGRRGDRRAAVVGRGQQARLRPPGARHVPAPEMGHRRQRRCERRSRVAMDRRRGRGLVPAGGDLQRLRQGPRRGHAAGRRGKQRRGQLADAREQPDQVFRPRDDREREVDEAVAARLGAVQASVHAGRGADVRLVARPGGVSQRCPQPLRGRARRVPRGQRRGLQDRPRSTEHGPPMVGQLPRPDRDRHRGRRDQAYLFRRPRCEPRQPRCPKRL